MRFMDKLFSSKGPNIPLAMFFSALCTILLLHFTLGKPKSDPIIFRSSPSPNIIEMPLVWSPQEYRGFAPIEQRGPEVRKWISSGLKISASGASGSGTIIYYDEMSGWAYVTSCGHLWSGNKSAEDLRSRPKSAKVTTWYHNNIKLNQPRTYNAEVLFWSNDRGYDSSLLRFRPDWSPD